MVNYSQLMVRAMMMMVKASVMNPPPVELRNRLQDGSRSYGGGIRGFSLRMEFLGYVDIYRKKEGTGGHTGQPRGRRRAPTLEGSPSVSSLGPEVSRA